MQDIDLNNYQLAGLRKINVILGKNGAGKSTLLKQVESGVPLNDTAWGRAKYVTPERGGVLIYEAGIEQNISQNERWMPDSRRVNQFTQFRQQSVAQFRKLELLVFREFEEKKNVADFQPYVDKINTLLDNIEIRRDDVTFKIYQKGSTTLIEAQNISSGESELISLAIECLAFSKEAIPNKPNLLFLDEPDVHLHPDLQARLVVFLKDLVQTDDITLLIATHSTALLGELSDYADAAIAFMKAGDKSLQLHPINDVYRRVLPVFGAHPLSNVFNHAPILLVEGDDDERLWQQAVRTSGGALKLYPVACDGIAGINAYEQDTKRIIDAVYDSAQGYSLRDRDNSDGVIDDLPPIVRMKLGCRAAENLILSNEVLTSAGTTWDKVKAGMDAWIEANPEHVRLDDMKAFQASGYERATFDLKDLRMLLVGAILASNKPWEVLVGQVLGTLTVSRPIDVSVDGSLASFLGTKTCEMLTRTFQ